MNAEEFIQAYARISGTHDIRVEVFQCRIHARIDLLTALLAACYACAGPQTQEGGRAHAAQKGASCPSLLHLLVFHLELPVRVSSWTRQRQDTAFARRCHALERRVAGGCLRA